MSKECLACGYPIEDDDVFCGNCGARVADHDDDYDDDGWGEEEFEPKTTQLVREKTGETITVNQYPFIIGRSLDCDFTVMENPATGRKHLRIDQIGNEIYVEDLGSANHTYIGDVKITGMTEVHEGTRIKIAGEYYLIEAIW